MDAASLMDRVEKLAFSELFIKFSYFLLSRLLTENNTEKNSRISMYKNSTLSTPVSDADLSKNTSLLGKRRSFYKYV